MERIKGSDIAKGLALATAYCGAYLASWYLSLDQWFLPAGLRAAALLFLPTRYWPYAFAGDAAALLVIRGPKAEVYSEEWAYLSPLLLMPLIALPVVMLRKHLGNLRQKWKWLPMIALGLAIWATVCNLTLNVVLAGPGADEPTSALHDYFRIAVGQFLGIMLLVPPLFVWSRRRESAQQGWGLLRDMVLAGGVLAFLYSAVVVPGGVSPEVTQGLLMMMILPAAGLTLIHGWRGAALGTVMVNVTIGLTLVRVNIPGAHDSVAFIAQQALAVVGSALLVLGTVISEHHERAQRSGLAEQDALRLAHSSFQSAEHMLREHLLYMAQMQMMLDDERKELAAWLKSRGHYEAAMDINSRGVMHRRVFDEQALALYPIRIEEQGLYAVVHSEAFSDFWAGQAEVLYSLRGQPRDLSVELQLTAYRCLCHAMALFSECEPAEVRIKMRVWRGARRRGIVLFIDAVPGAAAQPSQAGVAAAGLLAARVKAHGGVVRRHGHRVGVLLTEPRESSPCFNIPVAALSSVPPFHPGTR